MSPKTDAYNSDVQWTECAKVNPTEASGPARKEEMAERIVKTPAATQTSRGMRLLMGILTIFCSL